MKVGDYVRTNNGDIGILTKVFNEGEFIIDTYPDEVRYDCIKSSQNIIDLIEVGDYVNGFKVLRIDKECDLYPKTLKCQYPNNTDYFDIFNEDIKSIVTKEQFLQIEYKVGE